MTITPGRLRYEAALAGCIHKVRLTANTAADGALDGEANDLLLITSELTRLLEDSINARRRRLKLVRADVDGRVDIGS